MNTHKNISGGNKPARKSFCDVLQSPPLAQKNAEGAVLITGVFGFIGFHVARHLNRAGFCVIGTDRRKEAAADEIYRVRANLLHNGGIPAITGNLTSPAFVDELIKRVRPRLLIHLAAHASVRDANATKFGENVVAMRNLLEAASVCPPAHFVYASSSSVYGEATPRPFCESAVLRPPISPYAKSKFACEKIAADFARDKKLPVTGVRFFNVYGPWGRPDMAPFKFADALAAGRKAPIINGDTSRSWLYIDDAVAALVALAKTPPAGGRGARIVNVAGPHLAQTMSLLRLIARRMGKEPRIEKIAPTAPELSSNPANVNLLRSLIGFAPQTSLEEGIKKFLAWHGDEWPLLLADREKSEIARLGDPPPKIVLTQSEIVL